MKNFILQRTIAVQRWNVIGTVSKAGKRPELMPVLLRARELGQTNKDDIAEHLLFEPRSRRVVAERLLHIAAGYGLLDEHENQFSLTESGAAALDSEQVLVPEQGCWSIWASNDPLLDYPILRVDEWNEPNAFEELRGNQFRGNKQSNKEGNDRRFVNIPQVLRASKGKVATPLCGQGSFLRIDHIEDKCEEGDSAAQLRLVWNITERKMRLKGNLSKSDVDTVLDAPSIERAAVWKQLLERLGVWIDWDDKQKILMESFEKTTDRERESLKRDLIFDAPALDDFGEFERVTIPNVPLYARTPVDAEHWAMWRLQSRIKGFATAERFEAWWKEAAEPFATFRISAPNRSKLAHEAWASRGDRPPAMAWHLIAMEDWSL